MVGKIAVLAGLALAFGLSARAALTAAIALGQMGEFSFIFASVALDEGLFTPRENEALLAGIVLSMAVSPLLFTWRTPHHPVGPKSAGAAMGEAASRSRRRQASPCGTISSYAATTKPRAMSSARRASASVSSSSTMTSSPSGGCARTA